MSDKTITTEELRRFYDSVFATGDIHDNDKLYHWIVRLLKPKPGLRLLDVACGGGWLLRAAAQTGLEPHGLDISIKAVEKSKKLVPNAEVVAGDGEHLPWPEDYFDYVTCLGSLEHYLHPEIGVQEIARVMKSDGLACIMLPSKYQLGEIIKVLFTGDCSGGWQAIERSGTREQWKRLLQENGLAVTKACRYNKYPELFVPGSPWKVKSIRKFLITTFFRYCTPFNLSLQFVYLCRKRC